jgi:hypothetical protein
MMNLQTSIEVQIAKCFTDCGMKNFVDRLAILHARVDNAIAMFKERREIAASDVAILVNRSGEHGAAVFPIPGRIVCATSKERDAKRSSADYHCGFLL